MQSQRIQVPNESLDYTYTYPESTQSNFGAGAWTVVRSSGTETTTNSLISSGISFTVNGAVQKSVVMRACLFTNITSNTSYIVRFNATTSNSARIREEAFVVRTIRNVDVIKNFDPDDTFQTLGSDRTTDKFFNFAHSYTTVGNIGQSSLLIYDGIFLVDTGSVNITVQFRSDSAGATAKLYNNSYLEYIVV